MTAERCPLCNEAERHAHQCPVSVAHREGFRKALRERLEPKSAEPAAEVREWALPLDAFLVYAREIAEPKHWESHRVIHRLLDAYDAVCAERDELEEALGKAAIELGAPPNGLRIVVDQLRRELEAMTELAVENDDQIGVVMKERDEARAALYRYANQSFWEETSNSHYNGSPREDLEDGGGCLIGGRIAREALGQGPIKK